ncbi:MAG: hypothetical protein ACYCZI_03895 [Metallibacterium scheffleri]
MPAKTKYIQIGRERFAQLAQRAPGFEVAGHACAVIARNGQFDAVAGFKRNQQAPTADEIGRAIGKYIGHGQALLRRLCVTPNRRGVRQAHRNSGVVV